MAKSDFEIKREERIKIKENIMALEKIKAGFNLDKYQIREGLIKEKNQNPGDEILTIALAELIREGKLPGSSVVSSYPYDSGIWQVMVQSFGTGNKIRLKGTDKPLEITLVE